MAHENLRRGGLHRRLAELERVSPSRVNWLVYIVETPDEIAAAQEAIRTQNPRMSLVIHGWPRLQLPESRS